MVHITRNKLKEHSSIFNLIKYRLEYSHIFFLFHPFKIYEFKELVKDVNILNSDVLLDIGCGNGLETLFLGRKSKVIYGIDIFENNLNIAKERSLIFRKTINCKFIFTKLEDIKFKTEFFDKIFSICVLEHISNYDEVLKESYRILKKGGQLIFSVDSLENIDNEAFIRFHRKLYYVENYFRKDKIAKILREIGFKNIKIYPICKSNYAKQYFIKLTKRITTLDHILSIYRYFRLRKEEILNNNNKKGLYYIIKCFK